MISNWKDISLENVKGVLLDLDNSIYPYDPAHKKALEYATQFASANHNIEESDFRSAYKDAREIVHHDLDRQAASHSRLLYFQKLYELLFKRTNGQFSLQMEEVYWTSFMAEMKPISGAIEFLQNAETKQIPVCIVTDLTAAIQFRKLMHLGIADKIKYVVSSEEAGIEKPAALIFERAMKKLQLNPSEIIMIGDSEKKDIKGAENLGIKAYKVGPQTR